MKVFIHASNSGPKNGGGVSVSGYGNGSEGKLNYTVLIT